jgi:hypothetical protein
VEEVQAATSVVGTRYKPCGAVVEEAEASLLCSLKETGAALMWKRRGASHPNSLGNRSEVDGSDASMKNGAGA